MFTMMLIREFCASVRTRLLNCLVKRHILFGCFLFSAFVGCLNKEMGSSLFYERTQVAYRCDA